MRRHAWTLGGIGLMGVVFAASACTGGPSASTDARSTAPDMSTAPCGSATNPILVGQPGVMFSPVSCAVKAGDTVHWTWIAGSHSVTSDDGTSFDSTIRSSGTFTYTVPAGTAAGIEIPYHCVVHATVSGGTCTGMCASLIVR